MGDINKAYTWAIQTCNADNVGYSQTYRNAQTVGGVTYYDCSSFINYALVAGGFETPAYAPSHNAFTTYTMPDVLIGLGFKEVSASGEILAGDIGVSSYHTEMCYEGGTGSARFMGAHTDGIALADQVSISTYTSTFPRLFRYGDGATGYGASMYVVAALAGNSWRESHINPAQEETTGGGYGLFQWTGGRRTNLETYLSEHSYTLTDGNGQLAFLIDENDWIGTSGGISSLDEFIKSSSTDLTLLVTAFCTCWERAGVPAIPERVAFAEKALNYINEHANDTSITSWIISTTFLTEEQALNNTVMMYRYLSAGGGGGGTITTPKSGLKVWQMIKYIR